VRAHDVVWLLLLNASILAIGTSALGLLFAGAKGCAWTTGDRIALGYAVGFALVGITVAHLALIGVAVGPRELLLGGAALVALDVTSRRRRRSSRVVSSGDRRRVGVTERVCLATIGVVGATALVGFARIPLQAWDGWVIWASRARSLYEWGGVQSAPFVSPAYGPTHLDYPIVLPSIEALVFRSLGRFDGRLVHIELVGLLLAFLLALWTLLRRNAPRPVVALIVLSIAVSPAVIGQLASNYADVPLAFFIALGLVALVLSIESRSWRLLCVAALFMSAASLTKNEGLLFAIVALVSAWVVFPGARRRVSLTVVTLFVAVAPWRIFLALHGISNTDFRLENVLNVSYLTQHSNRALPALSRLTGSALVPWDVLPLLAVVALLLALTSGLYRRSAFLVIWLGVSLAGLVAIYVISNSPIAEHLDQSANRVVASLVIGAASFVPLLAGRDPVGAPEPLDRESPSPLDVERTV
jgi:hypothetical protein